MYIYTKYSFKYDSDAWCVREGGVQFKSYRYIRII